MKRSPLNDAAYGCRPFTWKSPGGRGYPKAIPLPDKWNHRHYPPASFPYVSDAGSQACDGDFIPLDVSTPTMRHKKHNAANRYNPASGGSRGSPRWYNDNRGGYHISPTSNCGNRYPAYPQSSQHSPKFRGQKRRGYRAAHRQMNVSAYVDMNSFLEDPWQDLVKKLDNSKDTSMSEGSESESLSNSKLADSDLTERNKSSKDTSLDDSRCSQECKNERPDVSFEEQNTDLSKKASSSIESEIGDTYSDRDSPNESTCSDKICAATQGKNSIHSNVSATDADRKDI